MRTNDAMITTMMSESVTFRCPVCERRFRRESSGSMPFCSPRCQQIDLGRWLGENYSVPEPPRMLDPDEYIDEVPPPSW